MSVATMWSRWRDRRSVSGRPTQVTAGDALALADQLVAEGRPIEALDQLVDAWRSAPDANIEIRIRDLRRDASKALETASGRPSWPPTYDDPFPALSHEIPEIHRDELSTDIIGGAVLHHGVIIVRGLFDADQAAATLATLQRTQHEQHSNNPDPRWYSPYDSGVAQDSNLRNRVERRGGTWLADSPHATADIMNRLDQVGVVDVIADHLGERPAFSLQKSTLRRVEPTPKITGWHQDGSFLEDDVRTMNVWVALSSCGGTNPSSGMEILPRRMTEILDVDPDLGRASVSFDLIEEVISGAPIAHPEFEPGDALMFDERLLHRTALDPGLSEDRYAIECWFFAPSHTTSTYLPFLA